MAKNKDRIDGVVLMMVIISFGSKGQLNSDIV